MLPPIKPLGSIRSSLAPAPTPLTPGLSPGPARLQIVLREVIKRCENHSRYPLLPPAPPQQATHRDFVREGGHVDGPAPACGVKHRPEMRRRAMRSARESFA